MDKIYRVKTKKNKLGIVRIPSYQISVMGHRSLNNVLLEDGTVAMVSDDDLEEVNDRTTEIEE